jgi:hypothetical protein
MSTSLPTGVGSNGRSLPRPVAQKLAGAASSIAPAAKARPRAPTLISWPPPPTSERVRKAAPTSSYESEPSLPIDDDDLVEVDDPIARLRERVGELEFFATSWQAAGVCAAALAESVDAKAVLVHVIDADRRALRTIGVHGKKASDLLGATVSTTDDRVAATVVTNKKAMALRFDGTLPQAAPERFRRTGTSSRLLAVPVTVGGRCVAIVEILDAAPESALHTEAAAAHVTSELAAFLARSVAA